jgi:aminopeptidase N
MLSLLAALQSPLTATPDTGRRVHDALHYDISIAVSDTGAHIVGEVETTWRLGSSDPVVVPLDSAMRVVRVLVDGRENTRMYRTSFGRNEAIVYIPHEKGAGDSLKTRIRYHGTARDGLLVQVDSATGRRTFFADNWPDRAHRWLPVQDHPSDKATVSFRVEVPAGLKVIANGVLVRVDTLARDRVTWQYRLDEPVSPYNFVLGAGTMSVTPLAESACAVKCVPQSVWSFPEDSTYAAERFAVAPKIVEFFSTLVGRSRIRRSRTCSPARRSAAWRTRRRSSTPRRAFAGATSPRSSSPTRRRTSGSAMQSPSATGTTSGCRKAWRPIWRSCGPNTPKVPRRFGHR